LSIILKKQKGLYIAPKPLKIEIKKVPILVINSIYIEVLKIIKKISNPKNENI
jgi:hypothetical protein